MLGVLPRRSWHEAGREQLRIVAAQLCHWIKYAERSQRGIRRSA
jgi:hypothetical protein